MGDSKAAKLHKARLNLSDLPSEIRLQIWEYAFGYQNVKLWTDLSPSSSKSDRDLYEFTGDPQARLCDACRDPDKLYPEFGGDPPYFKAEHRYQTALAELQISKQIYGEAVGIFNSTMTVHIRSPEIIAYIRCFAPRSFRETISKVVMYVHFNEYNHFHWCMRLFELQKAFPALKCLNIEYHMRPPISYDNLQDVVYFYIPLLALPSPFNPVRFVVMDKDRTDGMKVTEGGTTYPTSDGKPGMTLHTQYMKQELLFQAHFLGDITTDDAIDEHTYVVRDLFTDPTFLATTHRVLESNRDMIEATVAAAYPPRMYPLEMKSRGFWNPTHLPALQHALLSIARRHERPWFERLQRKRVLELYVHHGQMTRREAEVLLDKQLAAMPEGEGIQEWLERIMLRADNDGGDVIAAAMMSAAQDHWTQEGEADSA